MKTIITSKLMRKCLILLFMIIGLVFVASSDRYTEPVAAAMCCEECQGDGDPQRAYDACGVIAYYTCGSAGFQQCFNDCKNEANQCYGHCIYCFSSGSGSCGSTGDCTISQYCGADNSCHYY
jgi:hypothetical protein